MGEAVVRAQAFGWFLAASMLGPLARAESSVSLPIPDRPQDAKSPPSGWCGETAIQEGLLHLGMWASQRRINAAGKPAHPDLYSTEIAGALAALGVETTVYSPKKRGFEAYAAWVADAIDHGDPVFAGVKLVPSEHPEWGLDHFVLVVGHGDQGLLVNTTWNRQLWANAKTTEGISFQNAFFAIRLRDISAPDGSTRARLTVIDESSERVSLRVECSGLVPGARVRVERRAAARGDMVWSEHAIGEGGSAEWRVVVEGDELARFRCVRDP